MSSPDEPLIWTTKGNVPIASLKYHHQWILSEDELVFVEEYFDGEEKVKRSVHVLKKIGVAALLGAGGLNG